jgi:polysaccharide pyruvyl transferase WcaK-like protein
MNIFHIYAQNYNVGDHLLAYGVQTMFSKWFDPQCKFKTFDIHLTVLNQEFIERLNQEADILLVGGGGLIHGIDKWMLNIEDDLIESIKIPIIVFGVGYNFFRGQDDMSERLKVSIGLMAQKALSFSVRNDGSQKRLLDQGLYFKEIPAPGFFLNNDCKLNLIKKEFVIIQLANDLRGNRGFTEEFNLSLAAVIKEIASYYLVLLLPHLEVDQTLNEEIYSLVNRIPNVYQMSWYDLIKREHLLFIISLYATARFVIAMRGHAQICPIGLNTPVITIASHEKVTAMANRLGYQFLNVEMNDPNFQEVLIEKAAFLSDDTNLANLKKYTEDILVDIKGAGEIFAKELRQKYDELKTNC